jgi:5-methylcytosine-specific restriction endonuclease McrA
MTRSTEEWKGKTDDAKIPDRVRDRVCRRYNDRCIVCTLEIGGKLRAELDHITPLILGGQHRESNLRLVCHECHKKKSAFEMKVKSKVANVRKKLVLGVKKTSRPIPGSRASGIKIKMNGQVERR